MSAPDDPVSLDPGRKQAWRPWPAGLSLPTWPRETRDTLFLLAVIAWTVAPHLMHLPGWCAALTALVLAWRARIALTGGALPGRWPVIAVLVVALVLTLLTERTLLGKEAGVTMLVVLMALKTLELRARRDATVVFFLGFFLVLTQCLYSQSLGIALAMLVSTWGLLTALVLGNMPVGRPSLWRSGAIAARSALLGLPLMAALFVLFPRFGPLWGLPDDGVGRTGLSGTLRLGGVAELANDDSPAFRVRFAPGRPVPAEALYFRGPVLTRFDGLDWQQTSLARAPTSQPAPGLATQGLAVAYELLLEPIRLPLLPLLEATPDRPGDAPVLPEWQIWQGADLQWHTERPVGERLHLSARAYPRYQLGLDASPGELDAAKRLPPGFNPRALAWAQQVHQQLGDVDARTRAAAVLGHVRQQNYVYTLAPGTYGRDAIDEFWLDRREGFCEHFATAFVAAMRAMDVPARVVTGYQGAEPPDADGWRLVRQSHAHAWAEYWQEGAGWLRADPTAAVAPERVRSSRPLTPRLGLVAGALQGMSPALAERLKRAWALADSRWTQWVMGWSRTRQFNLLQQLGIQQPDMLHLARGLVLLLALVAAGAAAWAWWDRRRLDPWQRVLGRIQQALRRIGVAAAPHHAPRTLAALVRDRHGAAGEALAAALEVLEMGRYGPHAPRHPAPPEARLWRPVLQLARRLRIMPA